MSQHKVSFIVPVYKVEAFLPTCLDSIRNQTLLDWECILVDDGSPDGCGSICDAYADSDSRFTVIHKANGGVSAARNDGIAAATGTWAYFVDSDDWLELDAAEALVEAGESNHVDCVMSYSEMVYPSGKILSSPLFNTDFCARSRSDVDDIQKYVLYQAYSPYFTRATKGGYAAPWGKFVRLSIIKDHDVRFDPYLKGVFDDGLYSLHLLEHCSSVLYLPRKTYNYRQTDGSLTNSFKPDAMDIQRRGYERIEEFLRTYAKDRSFWEAYYAHIVRFLGGYLSRFYFHPDNPMRRSDAIGMLRADLSSEPFATAAREVDISRLLPKDKFLAVCERNQWIWGLRLYLFARNVSNRL